MLTVYQASSIVCQPFSCQRDNLTIRGHVFRKGSGHLPAIIVCHEFMANQSTVRHRGILWPILAGQPLPLISVVAV